MAANPFCDDCGKELETPKEQAQGVCSPCKKKREKNRPASMGSGQDSGVAAQF